MSTFETLVPVRRITSGPRFHWFGYYDKLQFDPTCRYVLGMEVDFEHRSPRPGDVIKVGMIDLRDGDRWIELGQSRAWCWQQGCMLQWLPGSQTDVIWNDQEGDQFVSHILDVQSGKKRTLPAPVYTVSPDGRWAVTPDFRRINHLRPGYGYAGIPDPSHERSAPDDAGIWHVDLKGGQSRLILTFAEVAKIPHPGTNPNEAKHWFNHLLVNTEGSRFEFLHRWRKEGQRGFTTRMFTATPEGKDLYILDPSGHTSHFIWRDAQHILAWTRPESRPDGFYLFKDKTSQVELVGEGVMTQNGHCTYLPGNEWILNDTYPDKERKQHLYLYHVADRKRVPLGHFYTAPEYTGEWRCDLHPRFSPDGRSVVVDSAHEGLGRQMYLLDISPIMG